MPTVSPSRLPLVLTAVLAGVLVVLAALQWRWIGQWSDVEEARLQSALAVGAGDLDAAFSDALLGVADAFREMEVAETDAAEALATRWQVWAAEAPDPALLAAVYWVAPGPDPRLLRLDPEAPALREVAWPAALAPWQAHLADQPRTLATTPGTTLTVRFDDAERPASPPGIALPVLPGPGSASLPLRFVLLALDPEVLAAGLLPGLVAEHLVAAESFDVLVTGGAAPGDVLYASRPGLTADAFASPDLDQPFGPDAFSRLAVTLTAPVGGSPEIVELTALQSETNTAGRWRLRVQHEAGSIGAAVAGLRRRQLGLAFGVLLVLSAAAALLVRSAQAQRRLAQQQMEFVAGVTHELRTPLAVIRSAGENLADGVIDDPERARRYGALVRDESDRLGRLVEGVLALAGADTRTRAPVRLDLHAVIGEAVAQAQPVLDETGAALTVDVQDPLPPLDGDAAGLATALRNLLVNAARYGAGRVGLAVQPATHEGRAAVAFVVQDNGPGLDAADLPHLFDPFYRGAAAPTHAGAGLGLALVRRVAEAHGGTATARTAPEGGAVFTLTLPAAEGP